jgi:hypothetical protein
MVKILPGWVLSAEVGIGDEGAAAVMNSASERLEHLRAEQAQLAAEPPGDDVAHRLEAIRHDIELALADINLVLDQVRFSRDKT